MAPRIRRPRFDDRRPDDFEFRQAELGRWRDAVAPRPPPPLQRAFNVSARPKPVAITSEANALDWKRANGPMSKVHKDTHEVVRSSQAISAARAKAIAVSRPRAAGQRAKAVAADRRMFNPTSGPKTFYGTFARILPTSGGRFRFVLPRHVVPCVQRATRREVLFAKGKGGRGSHRKKRFGPNSHIGC